MQLDVHAPHEGDAVSERVNHHGHFLITTRRVEGDHLAARKARDVEPVMRVVAGRPVVAEGEVGEKAQEAALAGRNLRDDQHAVAAGGLKISKGRAGTGKSWTLQAVREAHEQDGRTGWDRGTVVIVDEAAMLDARVTGEFLHEARRSGAKLILAGDDRQLASIERGGLFAELRQRHGSAVVTEVTRQRVDWQRQAARDLAEGRVEAAVRAFARQGAIAWSGTQDAARAALVERWKADTAAEPDATRFVFAYTNRDVDRLNTALRQVRKERGELGVEHRFETAHGPASFAIGDRVQLTATLKRAGLYNGQAGVITGIDPVTGVIRARLDGPAGGESREVAWSAAEFTGFRHGYAGTIYKGQGRTLDHTYLYHSHHWRQTSSYVALTRQRERATIFAATETARDVAQLARQVGRGEVCAASLAWATRAELPSALRAKAATAASKVEAAASDGHADTAADRLAVTKREAAGTAWLIPPRMSRKRARQLRPRAGPGQRGGHRGR